MSLRQIINVLKKIRANAYAPDSLFSFSALAVFEGDICTVGVNWENIDRSIGCCAETSAIMNLVSCRGPAALTGIYLLGADSNAKDFNRFFFPCAECRQFIEELNRDENAFLHQIALNGKTLPPVRTKTLLPSPFVFRNYIERYLKKKTRTSAPLYLRGMKKIGTFNKKQLRKELENAAMRSFSPDGSYTQGAIILTESGYAYCGSAFNTANFKSSKNAITAALSMMISFDGPQSIKEVYFLHRDSRPIFSKRDFFPQEMQDVLSSFGCKNIVIFHAEKEEVTVPLSSHRNRTALTGDENFHSVSRQYRAL